MASPMYIRIISEKGKSAEKEINAKLVSQGEKINHISDHLGLLSLLP